MGGIVKPLKPLKLKDGQRVRIEVEEDFIEASFGIVKSGISLRELEEAYHEYILERAGAR